MKKTIAFIYMLFILVIPGLLQAQEYRLPPYQKFTLKNGLTVYLMEQHEVPKINVSVIMPGGAILDGEKSGLAYFTASALKHGSGKYSKSQLDETLDFIGASVSTYASKESAGLQASFAAKDKDLVLGIVYDVLTAPVFDTAEFSKEKNRLLQRLEQQKEMPRVAIDGLFDKFLYGNHVYANKVDGNISSVAALQPADIRKFYSENYFPNGAAIAIVGDFSGKDMKAQITRIFSGWQKGKRNSGDPAARAITSLPSGNRVLLVNKDDARETTFYIGSTGISRNNPDYIAVEVINTLFGGRFTSMLNEELRVNSGLTYGAGSYFQALKHGGRFVISTFTATPTTEAAIDKALEVLNRLHEKGVDEETLISARNYVKGQFPPDYETSGRLANLLTQMFWYQFDESFINNFQKNVDGLTVEKAQEIIKKYFPKDKLQFVLVGKSDDIKKIAEKYGPVTEIQIGEEVKKAF